jgi:hypothetical protein
MHWDFSIKHYRMIAFRVMWLIIAILVIFGARYWSLYEDARTKYLRISMKSSVAGVAQIFYDIGQGITEKSSSTTPVHANGEFSEYRFPFPDKKRIFNLRFDPLSSGGHVEIRQIRITDGLGNTFLGFHLKQLVPSNQISRWEIINDHISIDIDTNAYDPQSYIRLEEPLLPMQEVHPSYHTNLFLSFCIILLSVLSIYLWVAWNDKENIKKWICYGLIAIGFAIVAFYGLQTCLGIFNRSIHPVGGGDTGVYLGMAAQKWSSPHFYHGWRPPTVPIFYSLVNGAKNQHNIIMLQVIISYVSWIFLACMTVHVLKDYLAKIFAFFLIAFIPLNSFMHYENFVILSESLSISFLAIFLGAFLWYYNKRSMLSVIFLAIVALIFAFTRDTDAYRVLLMTLPILLLIVQQIRNKTRRVMRHAVLFIIFILIFIGSNLSSNNIACSDCGTPYTNDRWWMPLTNNIYMRILPFEDRVKYFEIHGLPVTPALMAMKHKVASSNNWQSATDPKLAAQREWSHFHGRQTFIKYLITHPEYVFSSAFEYRDLLLYMGGTPNAWFYEMTAPINARILSVFFLNDYRDLKVFIVLCPLSLILVFIIYMSKRKGTEGRVMMIPLIFYIILTTIPLGLLMFHGDTLGIERHSFTNIIQMNSGFVLFYLFMADLLMMKMRRSAIEK